MKNLIEDYKKFEKIVDELNDTETTLDVSKEEFLPPITLLALLSFIQDHNIVKVKSHPKLKKYIKNILNNKEIGKRIPFLKLPHLKSELDEDEKIFDFLDKFNYDEYLGFHSSYFIINELVTNVYNHSTLLKDKICFGLIFAYEYPDEDIMEFCIVDNGLSIPYKFEIAGVDFDLDSEAISKSIKIFSTENNCDGSGLPSVLKLAIEGNGGSALIVSRNASLVIEDCETFKYGNLENIFNGTLICLRIKKNQVLNFCELLDN